jgi:hypothetical protein
MGEIDRFNEMLRLKIAEIEAQMNERYTRVTTRVKQHLEAEIRRIIEKMMKQILRRVRRMARAKLVNEHMFSCVKETIDDLFDDLWPEIENEIMYAVRLQFDVIEEYKRPKYVRRCWLIACCRSMRASYLYALYPCKC